MMNSNIYGYIGKCIMLIIILKKKIKNIQSTRVKKAFKHSILSIIFFIYS